MAKKRGKAEAHANRRSDGQSDGQKSVVVVAGATASGKSAAALDIAEAFDGVVINADSMQVYRDLRILTARPSDADLARAPHALYGVLDGADVCSAGRWRGLAQRAVDDAHAAGRLPVLAGGTGFYLKAFEEGMADIPDVPALVMEDAKAALAAAGPEEFHTQLLARDPVAGARIRPTDTQRMLRAWSVVEHTGLPLSDWQQQTDHRPRSDLSFIKFVLLPDREGLYQACNARYEAMVAAGAVAEVEALMARKLSPDLPVMRAVGVREIAAYLEGEMSREDMIARGQAATRQYAKRQFTWFRHQMAGAAILNAQYSKSLRQKIFSKIRDIC